MVKPDMILPQYGVAIRTLGLGGNKYRREIVSLSNQTILPERIIIYIDENHTTASSPINYEEHVSVRKGMVAQRALRYDEIESNYILLLDDDVELAPDSAERMLRAMMETGADCVGADTYKNQDMPLWQKLYALLTNWVYPHSDKRWAFKIHKHGSFSYLRASRLRKEKEEPVGRLYPTQYVAGPCAMWRKETIRRLHWEDEMWMDEMEFSYMDDTVESYKLHVNGGKMFLLYDSGVKNLNAKTASKSFRSKATMFYTRSRLSFCVWWRTIYEVGKKRKLGTGQIALIVSAFVTKAIWLVFVNILAGILYLDLRIPCYYIKGLVDGWRFVHSNEYKGIRSYLL